jgi:hypothetical protein
VRPIREWLPHFNHSSSTTDFVVGFEVVTERPDWVYWFVYDSFACFALFLFLLLLLLLLLLVMVEVVEVEVVVEVVEVMAGVVIVVVVVFSSPVLMFRHSRACPSFHRPTAQVCAHVLYLTPMIALRSSPSLRQTHQVRTPV